MDQDRPTIPIVLRPCAVRGCHLNASPDAPRGRCSLHQAHTPEYALERSSYHERQARAATGERSRSYHESEAQVWARIAERLK